MNLPELYKYYVPLDGTFFMTIYDEWGRRKREQFQSLGLKVDIMWERPPEEKGITGSEVRRRMIAGEPWHDLVPPSTHKLMLEWLIPERLRRREEHA